MGRRTLTETLFADALVPQVDAQIIGAQECLIVRVDADGVDVVCMGICIDFPGDSGNDGVVIIHTRQHHLGRLAAGGHAAKD